MMYVCSYCGKAIRWAPDSPNMREYDIKRYGKPMPQLSHGICLQCKATKEKEWGLDRKGNTNETQSK